MQARTTSKEPLSRSFEKFKASIEHLSLVFHSISCYAPLARKRGDRPAPKESSVDNPDTLVTPPAEWLRDATRPRLPRPEPPSAFGVPASQTHSALQTDAYKEIVNKISWCLGSVYRVPYAGKRTAVRLYAERIAQAVVRDHGYPSKIAKAKQ